MKIWFDISNSPHVNMWFDFIRDLERMGHEVVITSRPLANTIQILDQRGLSHTIVGNHHGKNIFKKFLGYPIRVFQLWNYLRKKNIDLAVSQSSFHSPFAAFLLGIPSIYTNDNEHALGNIPAFVFATHILIPETMKRNTLLNILEKKSQNYPGIKEGIYLWRIAEAIAQKRLNGSAKSLQIFIRPEPATAQYYAGRENFMDDLLTDLTDVAAVTVLTRNQIQYNHYNTEKFSKLRVPSTPLSFEDIASDCAVFIGAGGSMTREMAMVGVPTVSVYQDKLLEVDNTLVEAGLMIHEPELTVEKIQTIIHSFHSTPDKSILMEKGKSAYQQFMKVINQYNNQNQMV
jgi:predicted glycosyltransferase